jgi:predicted DNA-binding antitoxin AbrB/MazE fold protein
MQALRGYYNGKEFVPLEKVNIKPNQKVIITVLDEYVSSEAKPFKKYIGKLTAASFQEISGVLKETARLI